MNMKAVFMDYTGTTVQENGREMQELIIRILKGSSLEDPRQAVKLWWQYLKEYESSSYAETYLSEEEIARRILERLVETVGLKENLEELFALVQGFWVHAAVFEDAKRFFGQCQLPVYLISNNGISYVEKSMEEKGIHPAGIVCSDMVRAYKPRIELFEKALEMSGCNAEEVIHIGDSYESDIKGAQAAGIKAVLVDREGKTNYKDTIVVKELTEVLELLNNPR